MPLNPPMINRVVEACARFFLGGGFWQKHQEYAALLVLVVFPLTTLKNLTTLVKFNSLGVFFLFFNIFFMVYQGVNSATSNNNQGWPIYVFTCSPFFGIQCSIGFCFTV